jgi:hypothetical protein
MKIRSIQPLTPSPILREGTEHLATSYRDMSLAFAKSDQSIRDLGLTPYNMDTNSATQLEPGPYYAGKKEVVLYFGVTEQDAATRSSNCVEVNSGCIFERDCRASADGKYTLTKISGNSRRYLMFTLKNMDSIPEVGKGHAYQLGKLDNNGFADPKLDRSFRYVYFHIIKEFRNNI